MPSYDFRCDNCNKTFEIRMSLSEHSEQKDKMTCQECHSKLTQVVAPLRFKLQGGGWFNQEYGITQQEMNSNLDLEKKIENEAYNMQAKDQNKKEF